MDTVEKRNYRDIKFVIEQRIAIEQRGVIEQRIAIEQRVAIEQQGVIEQRGVIEQHSKTKKKDPRGNSRGSRACLYNIFESD